MKIFCVILAISLLTIGATVAKEEIGEWEDNDPFQEAPDMSLEDDAVDNTYQPLDEPAGYYQQDDIAPQQQPDQQEEAPQEEDETLQEDTTNGVQTQDEKLYMQQKSQERSASISTKLHQCS